MKTLPLTARKPRPFTPPTLKGRYLAELDAWEAAERAYREAKAANEGRADSEPKEPVPPKPGKKPTEPVFMLAVPTSLERDTLSALLFELGVVQITRETVRNVTLEEAFVVYGDEKGEEIATFLEGFWLQQELYEDKFALWQEQERQRVLDEFNGGDKREPYPMPEHDASIRDRMRAKREVDELIARSQTLRRKLGEQTSYAQVNGTMLVRLHLRGWSGLKTTREAIGPAQDGQGYPPAEILTEECTGQLREEIGNAVWSELIVEIDGQYALTPAEVGNSASPPENGSSAAGSTAGGEQSDTGASPGPKPEAR